MNEETKKQLDAIRAELDDIRRGCESILRYLAEHVRRSEHLRDMTDASRRNVEIVNERVAQLLDEHPELLEDDADWWKNS